jgi:hypothetical protein
MQCTISIVYDERCTVASVELRLLFRVLELEVVGHTSKHKRVTLLMFRELLRYRPHLILDIS